MGTDVQRLVAVENLLALCEQVVVRSTAIMPPRENTEAKTEFVERAIASIGSTASLVLHTIVFVGFFALASLGIMSWNVMLLVLTTLVSLEAIYLAIFIQITVNRHTKSLREVEEDIDEIQEDVEELGEDVEDIQEDIEDISEDIDEMHGDVEGMSEEDSVDSKKIKKIEKKALDKAESVERLAKDLERVLSDLEALKKGQ